MAISIRDARRSDDDAIWSIIGPAFQGGLTYPIPRDISRPEALAYWRSPGHVVYVAEQDGDVVGSYYLRANQRGGGAHVANCGYIVALVESGRGIARAMCLHSIDEARRIGFTAMQFNFVVATNERAVKLWESCGFKIVGTLPGVFQHPTRGFVDAHVMHRML